MKSDFVENWRWQEARIPQAVEILRENAMHLLSVTVANRERDTKQATDLIISVDGGDVALRIRRADCRYRDLTIRAFSNGHRTELHKIREGFARWYLYCWMRDQQTIGDWMLVDIDRLRQTDLLGNHRIRMNKGGNTGFIAITPQELNRAGCLLATNIVGIV